MTDACTAKETRDAEGNERFLGLFLYFSNNACRSSYLEQASQSEQFLCDEEFLLVLPPANNNRTG